MANIFDVAKKAGVSTYTVSRALNGHKDVSEKTRSRIAKIAEELNYYPNAAARSLQGKRTNTIALGLWPRDRHDQGTTEAFFQEFIGKIAMACLSHDLSLLIIQPESAQRVDEVYNELAGSGRADGVILTDTAPEDSRIKLLTEIGLPFVAYGRTANYTDLSYPFVDIDGTAGALTIFNYLYQQGHRQIAYLSAPFYNSTGFHRLAGYKQALAERNLEFNPHLVHTDLHEFEEVEKAVTSLMQLSRNEMPTAIMTNSDQVAVNVIKILQKKNISVGAKPGQIAVTGFDDLSFFSLFHPTLTTAKQPLEIISRLLLDLLTSRLDNKNMTDMENNYLNFTLRWLGTQQVLLDPPLIIRESA